MAKISVLVSANLKDRLGRGRFSIEAGNALAALELMSADPEYGVDFSREVYAPGKPLKPYCIFMVNGQVVDSKRLRQAKLSDGDVLHILAPVGGG